MSNRNILNSIVQNNRSIKFSQKHVQAVQNSIIANSKVLNCTTKQCGSDSCSIYPVTRLNGTGIVRSNNCSIEYINGTSGQFVKADGSLDTNEYISFGGFFVEYPLIFEVIGDPTGILSIPKASGTTGGYLSSSDWQLFHNYSVFGSIWFCKFRTL